MSETHNFFTFFVTLQRVTLFMYFIWIVWLWFFRTRNMWQCTVSFANCVSWIVCYFTWTL